MKSLRYREIIRNLYEDQIIATWSGGIMESQQLCYGTFTITKGRVVKKCR